MVGIGTLPIGHGIAITPVQMAAAYGTVANDGVWHQPHLVDRIGSKDRPAVVARRILTQRVARQVRRMIRYESIITALIGAAIGIVLGLGLATLLIVKVDFLVFSFPTTQVVVFFFAAIVVGIIAAIFPARRAARLNPLEAIAYE